MFTLDQIIPPQEVLGTGTSRSPFRQFRNPKKSQERRLFPAFLTTKVLLSFMKSSLIKESGDIKAIAADL